MESQSITAGEDALRIISEAISSLRRRGGIITDDEAWSRTEGLVESTKLPMQHEILGPALKNALDGMKDLEEAKDALYEMARSADRRLETLKKEVRPSFLHHGVNSLPEETLVDIFQFVVDDYNAFQCTPDRHPVSYIGPEEALSRVSRRFRRLVLGQPRLWSRLTSQMVPGCVMRHLYLSKDAKLTVLIPSSRWSVHLDEFLYIVTQHTSRWVSFHFMSHFRRDSEGLKELEERLGNLYLPNLETLKMRNGDDKFQFFKTWKMPKVCRVWLENISLTRIDDIFVPAAITSLAYTWGSIEECDLLRHLDILAPMSSLIDLRLCFMHMVWKLELGCTPRIHLPRLASFHLEIDRIGLFWELMGCLDMPVLERMSLDIQGYGGHEPDKWIKGWSGYPSVKELDFSFYNSCMGKFDLALLLEKFLGLEHLVLRPIQNEFRFCGSPFYKEDIKKIPPLRSIVTRISPPYDWLSEFVRYLKRGGRWAGFENFQLLMANPRDDLTNYIPREKVMWLESRNSSLEFRETQHPYFYDFSYPWKRKP